MSLVILALGYGNTRSVALACERLGARPVLSAEPAVVAAASRIILPGVGAAGFAMTRLRELGLDRLIPTLTAPVLGICLGMQLLFEWSEEDGAEMLGILPGAVRRLEPKGDLRVPHMGWSRLAMDAPVMELDKGDYVYFAHSYAAEDGPATLARADHGGPVPAIVRHDNFIGAQFHPERSGAAGARFLEAFLT